MRKKLATRLFTLSSFTRLICANININDPFVNDRLTLGINVEYFLSWLNGAKEPDTYT